MLCPSLHVHMDKLLQAAHLLYLLYAAHEPRGKTAGKWPGKLQAGKVAQTCKDLEACSLSESRMRILHSCTMQSTATVSRVLPAAVQQLVSACRNMPHQSRHCGPCL